MTVSLLPFISRLKIVTKDLRVERLEDVINYAQQDIVERVEKNLNDRTPSRFIVLKARQVGISTITEGLMFTLGFAIPRMQGLVVSHESDSAAHLLNMTRTYWDTWDFKDNYTPANLASNHLKWKETQSALRIATAKNVGAGRSRTIQFLHASEVAFWDHPAELMTGLGQAVPSVPQSFIIMESTANGVGNYFYNQWHAAVNGDSEYTPLFYPWWKHPEYCAEAIGWDGVQLTQLDDEERSLERFLKKEGLDEDEIKSRMLWRRYAIPNLCQSDLLKFQQEYPAHPEEAFVSTGQNVFDQKALAQCYQPMDGIRGFLTRKGSEVTFTQSPNGELKIFSYPSSNQSWGQYVAFADPARSAGGGSDYAVIQVMNRRTWEQVAIWRGKIDPASLGDKLIEVALYYNAALANCEITGPGYATISWLMAHNYPFLWENRKFHGHPTFSGAKFGWESTFQTKQAYISYLRKAVEDGDITIHDSQTYAEMKNYITIDKGFGNADEEEHDDTVTSLAGALITVISTATELDPYEPMSPPDKPARHAVIQPIVADTAPEDYIDHEDMPEWMNWEDEHGVL